MIRLIPRSKKTHRDELIRLKNKAKELMLLGDLQSYFKTLLEVQQLEQRMYAFKMN